MANLKNLRKWIVPIFAIALIMSSINVFGLKWWLPRARVDPSTIMIIFFTTFLFEITVLILNPRILKSSIIILKDQMVVRAIQEKDGITLLIIFPLTMLFEELLFRLFVFIALFSSLGLFYAIIIGALIFSLYHIHIWFEFKSKEILLSFILFSALLGLILNFTVYHLGLLICVIVHSTTVFGLFYDISKRINKKNNLA